MISNQNLMQVFNNLSHKLSNEMKFQPFQSSQHVLLDCAIKFINPTMERRQRIHTLVKRMEAERLTGLRLVPSFHVAIRSREVRPPVLGGRFGQLAREEGKTWGAEGDARTETHP